MLSPQTTFTECVYAIRVRFYSEQKQHSAIQKPTNSIGMGKWKCVSVNAIVLLHMYTIKTTTEAVHIRLKKSISSVL